MSAADFLDTNVLVYAYSYKDSRKQEVAQELIAGAIQGKFVISAQVLSEFASALLLKAVPRASGEAVIAILDTLSAIKLVSSDREIIRRAIEAHAAYGLHFYDGLIVAAAERAGCELLWSEDFNAGQKYFGVTVANPFH